MRDDVVAHINDMMSLYCCPKHSLSITSIKYSHRTLSKDLAMPSLSNSIGVLDCSVDILEIILYATSFDESALAVRDQ